MSVLLITPISANAATTKPTLSTIKIGVISSDTSPAQGNTHSTDVPRTLAAWKKWVNSHGGLNGHPVDYTEKDDKGDAAQALTFAKDFASDPSILAVMSNSSAESAYASTLQAANIPVFCLNTTSANFPCTATPNFFPAGTTVLTIVYGQPYVAQLAGGKKFATVQCSEVPACAQALPLDKKGAEAIGMDFVYGGVASGTAPNYTAQCLAAKNAGADSMFAVPGGLKFIDDCARQGYKPIWVISDGTTAPAYLKDPNTQGTNGDVGALWMIDKTPGQHTFRQAMGKDWPAFSSFTSPSTVASSWAGMQMFAAATAKVPASPTRQDIFTGVYGLGSDFTLDGFIPPQTITQGKPTTNACFFVVRVKNKQWTAPFGTKTYCEPQSLLPH
jgi:branched-chain amino acid transport system substrate-binding protein